VAWRDNYTVYSLNYLCFNRYCNSFNSQFVFLTSIKSDKPIFAFSQSMAEYSKRYNCYDFNDKMDFSIVREHIICNILYSNGILNNIEGFIYCFDSCVRYYDPLMALWDRASVFGAMVAWFSINASQAHVP